MNDVRKSSGKSSPTYMHVCIERERERKKERKSTQIYQRDGPKSRRTYLPASLGACIHICACSYNMSIGVPGMLRLAKVEDRPSSVPRSLSLFLSVCLSISLSLVILHFPCKIRVCLVCVCVSVCECVFHVCVCMCVRRSV